MRIGKSILIALAFGAIAPAYVLADDYVDDIYFNPKKDTNVGAVKKNPNYIENFSDMDVDAYNLRGQHYSSPVDTIGAGVSADEDFVYTQQIQKYYNPTIVLDNAELLADVLDNSYGNVEIFYNGLTPTFLPLYGYGYGWPYYSGYYSPWAWNVGWGLGWYDPWFYGPSWSWTWGWGPFWSIGWNWGPSWAWGGHGPGWGRPNSTWNPAGNRQVRPGVGWAGSGHNGSTRPTARPGNTHSASQWSIGGNHRVSRNGQGSSGIQRANGNGSNSGYTIGAGGHRYRGSSSVSNSSKSSSGNKRSGSSYNSTSRSSNSSTSTNRSSYNSSRSSGSSSYGGGSHRSSGGGSRSGGGGSRGTRR